ncbi:MULTISPECIES: transposase [Dasania]|uniref:transposase n=1 Tax=Dasania TaxID=503005 RepID=UPI0035CD2E46
MGKRYSSETIVKIVIEKRSGIPIHQICEKYAISESTFYRWQSEYASHIHDQSDNQIVRRSIEELLADIRLEVNLLKRRISKYGSSV